MNLREAFLASKLLGTGGGGGGGGNALDAVVQQDWDGTLSLASASDIRISCFRSDKAIKNVTGPNVSRIYADAFMSCTSLQTAYFPELTSVGTSAFGHCYSLASIYAPKLKTFANNAFASCSALQSVPGQENIETFYSMNAVFANCKALSQVILPKLIGTIGPYLFSGCTSLSLAILGNMTSASINFGTGSTFTGCNGLMSLYLLYSGVCNAGYSQYGVALLSGTPMSNSTYTGDFGSIYVPASLLSKYQSSTYWSAFSARFVGLTDEEIAALPI